MCHRPNDVKHSITDVKACANGKEKSFYDAVCWSDNSSSSFKRGGGVRCVSGQAVSLLVNLTNCTFLSCDNIYSCL